MRILVDTHAVLWWLADDDRLSDPAREAIATADEPLLSAATLFEVAIKASLDKLKVDDRWTDEALAEGFSLLGILPAHATALRTLPYLTIGGTLFRDPFDRMLIAQSAVERVPLVTADVTIAAHGVPVIW